MKIKLQALTEEEKSLVYKFFETWEKWWYSESKIRFMYWRMKDQGIRIEKAEEYLEKAKEKKMKSYRWFKEQEILKHLKDYKMETGDNWRFEFIKLNEWETGKSLIVGILKSYDIEKNKQVRSHVIDFDEWKDPEYFQEIVKRFNLVIE